MEKLNLFDDSDNELAHIDFGDFDSVYYRGELGNFWYNPNEFEIIDGPWKGEHLHYYGKGESVDLPKGCKNTRYMFYGRKLPDGFTLGDNFTFNTGDVINMEGMFSYCELPKGFTLGVDFDTINVTNMKSMFQGCKIPNGFTLGNKFDTSNVTNMVNMFSECNLPAGFTLGDKFDTSNVGDMNHMFKRCRYDNVSFREYFKTDDMKSIIALLKQ